MQGTRKTSQLCWQSDYNGYEVGYPNISVVGYYVSGDLNYYINAENGEILEYWSDMDEDND